MKNVTKYLIVAPQGYVAIDRDSGGYPYYVEDWDRAATFYTLEDAETYLHTMTDNSETWKNWKIFAVTLNLVPVYHTRL